MSDGEIKQDGRGGARPGAGRKPKPKPDVPPLSKSVAAKLYAEEETYRRWKELRDVADMSLRFQVEREIAHQAGHKPVHVVNHLHDKPMEVHMTLSLGERMRKAMQEAEERVSRRAGL